MAVLKSPKNVGKKNLWMRQVVKKNKKTSFYFYKTEMGYESSNIKAFASKNDQTLFFKKYRHIVDPYKEERRQTGYTLPSTMEKPILDDARFRRTHFSTSWRTNSKLRSECLLLVNIFNAAY